MTMKSGTVQTKTGGYVSFDRVADVYESTRYIPPEILNEAAHLIVEDGGFERGAPFLDAGVGTGRFGRALAAQGLRVTGCDISAEMLRNARAASSQIGLVRADLRALPFRADRFVGALMVHVLHLITDWQRVVEEVRRTLRPGGRLYLGSEGGKNFRTRGLYFQLAGERGLSRPHPGAKSLQEALEYIAGTDADVSQIDGGRVRWMARSRVGDQLETIHQNAFSHLWHVPPDVHAELAAEVERRALETCSSLDEVEEAEAHVSIFRAAWDL